MTNQFKLPIHEHVFNQLDQAMLYIDLEGHILAVNRAAKKLLNVHDRDIQQLTVDEFFNKQQLLSAKEELSLTVKNNPEKIIHIKKLAFEQHYHCLLLNEISLEDQTYEVKQQIDRLVADRSEGFILFHDQRIIDCDQAILHMFGYSKAEIKGMMLDNLFDRQSMERLRAIDRNDNLALELVGVRKDGGRIFFELILDPNYYIENKISVAIIKDISERVEHEQRLEYLAYFDELTDLPNRNYFLKVLKDAIQEAKATGESLAVYYADLDYFKEINETFGYDFGDRLLVAAGNRIKAFKDTDTFIARVGGDEFVLLERNITEENPPIHLAEQLIAAFEDPLVIDGYDIFTSISIGISVFPENGETANDLIKHADSAMYVIKGKQRNHYQFFESSISEQFKTMLTMESDLRKAIKEQQFELHYQPQKSLHTQKIVGVEALLRWKHPEKGYIPPMDFIPLAEKTGLIIEIGDWVLEEACKQNKLWHDAGFDKFVMSVNLSARQFHQKNLVEKITDILEKINLDPQYLELEITESMAMTNEQNTLTAMERLRELGDYVSIVDFRSGYSSLRYLSQFPITKLKIDKIFMYKEQKQNRAIVKSIINMSHSLNMKVIAEGVETHEQFQFLKREKCDVIQGFYFSKPLPPNQLESLLVNYS